MSIIFLTCTESSEGKFTPDEGNTFAPPGIVFVYFLTELPFLVFKPREEAAFWFVIGLQET